MTLPSLLAPGTDDTLVLLQQLMMATQRGQVCRGLSTYSVHLMCRLNKDLETTLRRRYHILKKITIYDDSMLLQRPS